MDLARPKHGLFADYALPFYLPSHVFAIPNMPVPSEQLDVFGAMVFDGDSVRKYERARLYIRVRRLVLRLYDDLDGTGGGYISVFWHRLNEKLKSKN